MSTRRLVDRRHLVPPPTPPSTADVLRQAHDAAAATFDLGCHRFSVGTDVRACWVRLVAGVVPILAFLLLRPRAHVAILVYLGAAAVIGVAVLLVALTGLMRPTRTDVYERGRVHTDRNGRHRVVLERRNG